MPNIEISILGIFYEKASKFLHLFLLLFFLGACSKSTDSYKSLYQEAQLKLSQGQEAQSKILLRRAVQSEPCFIDALVTLGDLALLEKNYFEATQCYQEALTCQPDNSTLHNKMGLLLDQQGNTLEAKKHYLQAVDIAEAHNNLALIYIKEGNFNDAEKECREALGLNPEFAMAIYHLGVIYHNQGKYEEALSSYQEAARRMPNFRLAALGEAKVLYESGKTEPALSAVEKILNKKPADLDSLYLKGQILWDLGNSNQAEEIFLKILKDFPKYQPTYCSLAALYMSQGKNLEAAASLLQEAGTLAPEEKMNTLAALGWAYHLQGNPEKAVETLQQAIDLSLKKENETGSKDPNLGMKYLHFGLVKYHNKNFLGAEQNLRAAIKCGIPEKETSEAEKILKEIKTPL